MFRLWFGVAGLFKRECAVIHPTSTCNFGKPISNVSPHVSVKGESLKLRGSPDHFQTTPILLITRENEDIFENLSETPFYFCRPFSIEQLWRATSVNAAFAPVAVVERSSF